MIAIQKSLRIPQDTVKENSPPAIPASKLPSPCSVEICETDPQQAGSTGVIH
jgi:hypothetical protein